MSFEAPYALRDHDRAPRIPHGPERAIAILLAVTALAGFALYKGWHRRFVGSVTPGAAPALAPPHDAPPRAAPAALAPANADATGGGAIHEEPVPPEPSPPPPTRRRARAPRGAAPSTSPAVGIAPEPPIGPTPPTPEAPASTPPATEGFSIPEPAALPPGRDLAPPPSE